MSIAITTPLTWPDEIRPAAPVVETDEALIVHIPPLSYLRAMATLYWSCIRHPLSETTIDLSTGRVLCRT